MYRPGKYYRRGRGRGRGGYYRGFAYERSRHYQCKDCRIVCTSVKQLEEHLNGVKHKANSGHESMEDDHFPLEHMVVIDETEEDLPNASAASPASCDSSDSASGPTSDNFPSSHLVIIDETNDDNDHPASPASCDSSASESAPSILDVTPKKKIKIEKDDQTTESPLSARSGCHSSNPAPEAEDVPGRPKKFSSKKRYSESGRRNNKESIKIVHVEPIKNNQDVYKFLKTFAVANESDIAFAKKVKEMFSDALMKYKQIKLEEIYCTEAEHSPTEEPTGSTDDPCDHGQKKYSIPRATEKSSPPNSSLTSHTSNRTSSAERQPGSPGLKQSDSRHASSVASTSLTYKCDDASNNRSPTNSTNRIQSSVTEEDSLMESEDCVTAEAACSDDEDV